MKKQISMSFMRDELKEIKTHNREFLKKGTIFYSTIISSPSTREHEKA